MYHWLLSLVNRHSLKSTPDIFYLMISLGKIFTSNNDSRYRLMHSLIICVRADVVISQYDDQYDAYWSVFENIVSALTVWSIFVLSIIIIASLSSAASIDIDTRPSLVKDRSIKNAKQSPGGSKKKHNSGRQPMNHTSAVDATTRKPEKVEQETCGPCSNFKIDDGNTAAILKFAKSTLSRLWERKELGFKVRCWPWESLYLLYTCQRASYSLSGFRVQPFLLFKQLINWRDQINRVCFENNQNL